MPAIYRKLLKIDYTDLMAL